jgi:DNA-binding CsgD family transcriptional regulator
MQIDPRLILKFARVAESVGEPRFYAELLPFLGKQLKADLSMVMCYSRRNKPEYLIHEGLRAEHMELYLRGLYRVDPIYRWCRSRRGRGVKNLACVSTPAERAGDYFNIFLRLTGMADDLVVLLPVDGDASVGIVYERRTPFSVAEVAEMRTLYPLIESLHRVHQKAIRKGPGAQAREAEPIAAGLRPIDHKAVLGSFLRQELTPRERDIVHLMLMGYPNIKIAERLEISLNTIKNHKKRMYVKLNITTERELFLAFVNFLAAGRGDRPYGAHWQRGEDTRS